MDDAVGEIAVGGVKDDGGDVLMLGGKFYGERGADALAVEDDSRGWDVLRRGEEVECGVSVLLHAGFRGMLACAAAVAAVVEEQDIEACVVEGERVRKRIGD